MVHHKTSVMNAYSVLQRSSTELANSDTDTADLSPFLQLVYRNRAFPWEVKSSQPAKIKNES